MRHGRNDVPQLCEDAADELAALRAERDACAPYLKEGETPAERIERERRDVSNALKAMARDRDDALRYRWLREYAGHFMDMPMEDYPETPEELDAAIDAQRKSASAGTSHTGVSE